MRSRSIIFVLFLFFLPHKAFTQTRAQIDSALQQMTPEEIDQKLYEMGITREEAQRRAAQMNINLDDYLSRIARKGSADTVSSYAVPMRTPLSAAQTNSFPSTQEPVKGPVEVPGFTGRIPSGLQPFGYDIFRYPASTFQPVLNVATPQSYVLGSGDEIVLSVWGETKLFLTLQVNREGNVIVPEVGPIGAVGLTIQQLRDKMLRRMTAVYSSLKNGNSGASSFLDVSLGKLRTIQVLVMGEVQKPGGYAISSLATAIDALYLSGGPTINGSLRSIDIVRNGKTFAEMDFYDYALRADRSKDIHLQDGDIVFVKPIGVRVAIVGSVLRPALYELDAHGTLGDLLYLSGGLRFDAYTDRVHIERLIPFDERKDYAKNYLDFDLRFAGYTDLENSKFAIVDGDVITVFKVDSLPVNRVTILGNVKKPGVFQLKDGMRVRDLILDADSLERNTFSERGTILRLLPNLRKEIYSFNPRLALSGDPQNNLELKNEDTVSVYKESQFFPQHTVSIGGSVRNPGVYPRYDAMTVADLVVLAGGLTKDASLKDWELARLDTTRVGALSTIFKFDSPADYWNAANRTLVLQDFDHLMVPANPKYNLQRVVQVNGYVMYPGAYALREEGEKLSSIIKRAGGLRPGAYLEGSTLVRKWSAAGLVPVDFIKALSDTESIENISLLADDSITVAFKQEVILVRGEIFVPAAVVYKKGASLSYYLDQAGGPREDADEDRIVVTLPNGRKWEKSWFIFPNPDILGGSTIYVPKKIEKPDNTLAIVRDWSTIFVSLATMMVAIVQITK